MFAPHPGRRANGPTSGEDRQGPQEATIVVGEEVPSFQSIIGYGGSAVGGTLSAATGQEPLGSLSPPADLLGRMAATRPSATRSTSGIPSRRRQISAGGDRGDVRLSNLTDATRSGSLVEERPRGLGLRLPRRASWIAVAARPPEPSRSRARQRLYLTDCPRRRPQASRLVVRSRKACRSRAALGRSGRTPRSGAPRYRGLGGRSLEATKSATPVDRGRRPCSSVTPKRPGESPPISPSSGKRGAIFFHQYAASDRWAIRRRDSIISGSARPPSRSRQQSVPLEEASHLLRLALGRPTTRSAAGPGWSGGAERAQWRELARRFPDLRPVRSCSGRSDRAGDAIPGQELHPA